MARKINGPMLSSPKGYQRGAAAHEASEPAAAPPGISAPPDEGKSKEAFKSRVLTACGVMILVLALIQQAPSLQQAAGIKAKNAAGSTQTVDPEAALRNSYWSNPSIALYERYFCRGSQRAMGCSERPLHPFVAIYERYFGTVPDPLRKEPSVRGETLKKDFFDRYTQFTEE